MNGALREALAGVRARRGRVALSGVGIALAAAMLTVAATVAYGLDSGFSRSARAAHLADVIVRFDAQSGGGVAARIRALPDVSALALRDEVTDVAFHAGSHSSDGGVVEVLHAGPHGYQVVAGRDVSGAAGGVVLEQGVASAWGLTTGDFIDVGPLGPERIVGVARSPDNVAYPLASPRLYITLAALQARLGAGVSTRVDLAEIWLRDPAELNVVLAQARMNSYGLRDLSIVTRSGVHVLIDQAAGIVIALLAALSLVALLTAAVMLAAAARAEVQRRLRAIGVRRAIGATRGYIAAVSALEAVIVAAPAAALGVGIGALAAIGPSDRLLLLLNEAPPGTALVLPLLACFAAALAIPTLAGAWPAWRAAGRAPVALLRGAELRPGRLRAKRAQRAKGGLLALGARLTVARRIRLVATLTVLSLSCAFVLLMLALASELSSLSNDPAALGRRYQLTASLPPNAAKAVRALPGVQAVAPRYEVTALDSFALGEIIDVVAYPGDHTVFEDPPLTAGRRLRGQGETEVGEGLAQVLGLSVGSTLALALPSGRELRLRVSGVVSSLDHDGRIAYVPAAALLAADPAAPEQLAVRLQPGANAAAVEARLNAQGAGATATQSLTSDGHTLVAVLAALLRAIAVVDGLVCLYTLVQALALTAHERRPVIALLRACGAGAGSVRMLLTGAALAVVVPAAVVGVELERLLLGPAMGHIAAGYVQLALAAGAAQIGLLAAGLMLLVAAAVWWVARRASGEAIARGLV